MFVWNFALQCHEAHCTVLVILTHQLLSIIVLSYLAGYSLQTKTLCVYTATGLLRGEPNINLALT